MLLTSSEQGADGLISQALRAYSGVNPIPFMPT